MTAGTVVPKTIWRSWRFWAHHGCLDRELGHAGDFPTVSSHSCQVLVSCARLEAVTSNGTRLAGSLVSPKLGCGAGGACPVLEGHSRIRPSLTAPEPSLVMAWPQGPQEHQTLLTCWVLCTGLCQELFAALRCYCGQLCHKHQL